MLTFVLKCIVSMKNILLISGLLVTLNLFGQGYKATLNLGNTVVNKIYLLQVKGDFNKVIDSASVSENNKVYFKMRDDLEPGMYRFAVSPDHTYEFIYNYENVELSLSNNGLVGHENVIMSDETKKYYERKEAIDRYLVKAKVLLNVITQYPEHDDFYTNAILSYEKLLFNYHKIEFGEGIGARIANASREYLPSVTEAVKHSNYKINHYFDFVDFSDTILINSYVISDKVIGYITEYNRTYGSSLGRNAIFAAVDSILLKAEVSFRMYGYVTNFLLDGFERMNMNEVVMHVSQKYNELYSCSDGNSKSTLERRIYSNTYLKVGDAAPLLDKYNVDLNSGDIHIILFWASWCEHCKYEIPQALSLIGKVSDNVKWYFFSLDEDVTTWRNYIDRSKMSSLGAHYCSGLSWDADYAQEYSVYATPTFFVVKNGRIIGKPMTASDLQKYVD